MSENLPFPSESANNERAEMIGGLAAMGVGPVLFLFALGRESLVLFVVGALLVGFGQGVSYRGSLAALQQETHLARRGEVMGAYYLAAYVGVAILIPMVGLLIPDVGLVNACTIFCGILSVIGALSSLIVLNLGNSHARAKPAIGLSK